jgi:hypothetical protein
MFSLSTYVAMLPALLILAITSLVRANDIGWHLKNWHWNVRRFGFMLTGAAATGFMTEPVWHWHLRWLYVFCAMCLVWGFALTWLTTPGMPPWWRYVSGAYRLSGKAPRRRDYDQPLP